MTDSHTAKMAKEALVRYSNSLTDEKFLIPSEVTHLESILEKLNQRDQLLFSLLLYTGARASEVLSIEKHDLDHQARDLKLIGLKGSRARRLPLSKHLFNLLTAYIANLPADQVKLFTISYDRLHSLWQNIRPVKKKLHSLRHTRAVQLQSTTKDLKLVQYVLGHANIQNTMIYLDVAPDRAYLKKALG